MLPPGDGDAHLHQVAVGDQGGSWTGNDKRRPSQDSDQPSTFSPSRASLLLQRPICRRPVADRTAARRPRRRAAVGPATGRGRAVRFFCVRRTDPQSHAPVPLSCSHFVFPLCERPITDTIYHPARDFSAIPHSAPGVGLKSSSSLMAPCFTFTGPESPCFRGPSGRIARSPLNRVSPLSPGKITPNRQPGPPRIQLRMREFHPMLF